jgi:hypothetical protein
VVVSRKGRSLADHSGVLREDPRRAGSDSGSCLVKPGDRGTSSYFTMRQREIIIGQTTNIVSILLKRAKKEGVDSNQG